MLFRKKIMFYSWMLKILGGRSPPDVRGAWGAQPPGEIKIFSKMIYIYLKQLI